MFKDSRYNRQEAVPLFGAEGQCRLSASSVAVVGSGGVKSPILLYLAAAGIGRIKIVDFDKVELSNLNRQILYEQSDTGRYKAEAAAERLQRLNPDILVEYSVSRINSDCFEALIGGFDLVFEGGESDTERRLFNRQALALRLPYIHASAHFNYSYVLSVLPGKSCCLECIYFDPPRQPVGPVPIMGPACGIAGTVAASEAINFLAHGTFNFANRIWFHDGWSGETLLIPSSRRPTCTACGNDAEESH